MDRLQLQSLLETLLGTDKVYFQPPNNLAMVYPCIVYEWDDVNTMFANNSPYVRTKRYSVTVIDRDPDSLIPDKIGALPFSEFNRSYKADNLNHTVYILFA